MNGHPACCFAKNGMMGWNLKENNAQGSPYLAYLYEPCKDGD